MLSHLPQALTRWQYAAAAVLRDAPLRLDPATLPQAERVLDELSDHAWAYPSMSHLVTTLAMRAEMRQELDVASVKGATGSPAEDRNSSACNADSSAAEPTTAPTGDDRN